MRLKATNLLLLLILLAGAMGAVWYFFLIDTTPPTLSLEPATQDVAPGTEFVLTVVDPGKGIRSLQIVAAQNGGRTSLLERTFTPPEAQVEERFTLEQAKLKDGPISLQVVASDASISHFGKGNLAVLERQLNLDSVPPIASVNAYPRYVRQGGVGCVSFVVNEKPARAGVMFGDLFFPAYPTPTGPFVALYAHPHDLPLDSPRPIVVAEDAAGNRRRISLDTVSQPGEFREDKVVITDRFLTQAIAPFADRPEADIDTLFKTFLYVNRDLRQQDNSKIYQAGRNTEGSMLWKGVFGRMPNGAPKALFGDHRFYY